MGFAQLSLGQQLKRSFADDAGWWLGWPLDPVEILGATLRFFEGKFAGPRSE